MLVITGLGRCGMSLLGQALLSMNYRCGKDVYDYMLKPIHDVNLEMCEQLKTSNQVNLRSKSQLKYWKGQKFENIIKTCTSDANQAPIHFILEPLFMWNSELLKAWWRSRKDLRFVILHRRFEDYAKLFDDVTPYKEAFAECITTLTEMKTGYHIALFPNFKYDAKPMFRGIRKLGLQTCHIVGGRIMKEILEG